MNKSILILLAILIVTKQGEGQVPANDDCLSATILIPQSFDFGCGQLKTATTIKASPSIPGPTCAQNVAKDVWFKFTANSQGIVIRIVDPVNASTGVEEGVAIALYRGDCIGGLLPLDCDTYTERSHVLTNTGLRIGDTYYIRVWASDPFSAVSFGICLQSTSPPVNDECSSSTPINLAPEGDSCKLFTAGTTLGASTDDPDIFSKDEVWYSFVANNAGVEVRLRNILNLLDTSDRSIRISLALYSACNQPILYASSLIISTEGSMFFNGLTPGKQYYLSVGTIGNHLYSASYSFDLCIMGDSRIQPNDFCVNARWLPVQEAPATSLTGGSFYHATYDTVSYFAPCSSALLSKDLWYQVKVPASGRLIIESVPVDTIVTDVTLVAFSGTCDSKTYVACDNGGNQDPFPADMHGLLDIRGQQPGDTLLIQVLPKLPYTGNFRMVAWDPASQRPVSVQPEVNCKEQFILQTDTASGNVYWWNPLLDDRGGICGELFPEGQTNQWIWSAGYSAVPSEEPYYLERHLSITGAGPKDSITIAFYFTELEWERLQSAGSGLSDPSQLIIYLAEPGCGPLKTTPSDIINPLSVTRYLKGYRMLFRSLPGYAYYAGAPLSSPLPVTWGLLTTECQETRVLLHWQTLTESNSSEFIIEQSNDGHRFAAVGKLAAAGNSTVPQNYQFEAQSVKGSKSWFRIRQVDMDGSISYSKTLQAACNHSEDFQITPNPATAIATISWRTEKQISHISILDVVGRTVHRVQVIKGRNTLQLDLTHYLPGIYMIVAGAEDRSRVIIRRFVKN